MDVTVVSVSVNMSAPGPGAIGHVRVKPASSGVGKSDGMSQTHK